MIEMKKVLIFFALFSVTFMGLAQNNDRFTSLFNGRDLVGWNMPGKVPGFEVEDGILVAYPRNGSELFTEEQYGNFVFKFEYLLSEVGNSGVLIRCNPENPWGTGVEVQLLAPWTPYRDDLHCTGSIYGYVAVNNRPDETTGIWHEMEIKCDRKRITISVDGAVTTTADIDTVKSMQGKNLTGFIGFQSNHSKEGEYAHFRNISILDLDNDPEYVKKGFYSEDPEIRKQAMEVSVFKGSSMVKVLIQTMDEDNTMAQAGAKQALFDIVAGISAPNAIGKERAVVAKMLKEQSMDSTSEITAEYLKWLLEMLNRTITG
jgi:hypothetical protein